MTLRISDFPTPRTRAGGNPSGNQSFEVEEDLLYNADDTKSEYKYTTREPQGEGDSKIKKSGENGEEVESDSQSKRTKPTEKKHRSAGFHEKCEGRKGKQPVLGI